MSTTVVSTPRFLSASTIAASAASIAVTTRYFFFSAARSMASTFIDEFPVPRGIDERIRVLSAPGPFPLQVEERGVRSEEDVRLQRAQVIDVIGTAADENDVVRLARPAHP